jgi:hypothetical protein
MRCTPVVWGALGIASIAAVLGGGCGNGRSPVEPSPVCTFAIAPATREFTEDGGTGAASLATTAGCAWTAASTDDWLVITSPLTGTGPASVAYTVGRNAAATTRSASIAVGGQRHTVTQAGRPAPPPCTFALTPGSVDVGKDATDGTFAVTAAAGCTWTAVSLAPWVTVTAGSPGSGPGRVAYAVARNPYYAAREAAITVGDQAFTVRQAGDLGVPGALNGVWNGRLIDYPGGRTFQMTLAMAGERVTGRITGDGTGGGGFISGTYVDGGPVQLVADFGDGKQYFDGAFDGPDRVRGTSTYNQRPPVYRFEMSR